jgi:prevent-host-death family protein
MKKTKISVTEAARNFADYVNRTRYQKLAFVLVKNGKPVAQLVPDNEKVCLGRDAAEALAKVKLPPEEARAWRRDLKAAQKILKPPIDKWR